VQTRCYANYVGELEAIPSVTPQMRLQRNSRQPFLIMTVNTMGHRIVFAALCGAGLTALLSLALNLPYVNLLAGLLLLPGSLLQSV
jgi:hypothetical protein